jgi:hypothetical protein
MSKIVSNMRSSIPEGESGKWSVRKFSVSKDDADFGRMRAAFSASSLGRYVPEGEYTGLYIGDSVMMSDTPDELCDHIKAYMQARGTCLISGLGLGCITEGMLKKTSSDGNIAVEKVIVLEKSEDVIKLVGPYLLDRYGDRLEIRNVDALEYKSPRGERYDVVWHDIWLNICLDNLDDMSRLHRKYGRKADWQGSWQRERLMYLNRMQKKNRW